MSGDNEKSVFDRGRAGIGHNQGPPLDDPEVIAAEPEANANARSGSKLTKEAIAWLRAREKSGEIEKVTWVSPYGSGVVKNYELRLAGPSRPDPTRGGKNCKWRNPDGLVSRRGYRRVFRGDSEEEKWLKDQRVDVIRQTAARVLYGPYATIFEKYYFGECTVEELAAQFGKPSKRIYKILDKCRQRIERAVPGQSALPRESKFLRSETVREYIDDAQTAYFEFRVDYWAGEEPFWRMIGIGSAVVRREPPVKKEPDEKWKIAERERSEFLRNRINRQAENRGGSFGDILSQQRANRKSRKKNK